MAFMVPVAEHFEMAELVESTSAPFECSECGKLRKRYNITAGGDGQVICTSSNCAPPIPGWYSRLSAPGYMDCTSWHGPYSSEEKALKAVMEQYDVDENGDDADEGEE